MKKVINPCWCRVHKRRGEGYNNVRGFAKIEFVNGRLSICGVIGPMANGYCRGSAGQCTEEIRKGKPADGWTREMLDKLCDIWDEWHLNDMKPYCEHQEQLGWAGAARLGRSRQRRNHSAPLPAESGCLCQAEGS